MRITARRAAIMARITHRLAPWKSGRQRFARPASKCSIVRGGPAPVADPAQCRRDLRRAQASGPPDTRRAPPIPMASSWRCRSRPRQARLARLSETITISASYYGDPAPSAAKHTDEVGQIDLGRASVEIPGPAAGRDPRRQRKASTPRLAGDARRRRSMSSLLFAPQRPGQPARLRLLPGHGRGGARGSR